jgi:hypothetical protein
VRLLTALLGLAYAALLLFTGFWGVLTGLVDCWEECSGGRDWSEQPNAWQWNAIAALSAVSVLAGLLAIACAFRVPRVALAFFGLQVAAAMAATAFLVHVYDWSILWWLAAVVGPGLAFFVSRGRSISGNRGDARGIPEGRSV